MADRRRGGVLRMGQATDLALTAGHPFALIPQNRILGYATAETVIEYRNELVPELLLAERFELSDDFETLLVELKPDLEFHNGASVTSEDLRFGVEVLQDPVAFGAPGAVQLTAFAEMITDARILDERTVEFRFDRPRVNIADFFAQLPVTHASSWEKQQAERKPVGSGPFQFSDLRLDGYELERFEGWHGGGSNGSAFLDGIKVSVFPDQVTTGFVFEAENLDAYLGMSPTVAAKFRGTGRTRLARKTGINYLGMNVQNPQLQDPRIRRAIFYAIDREFLAKHVGQDFAAATAQPWSASSPAFDPRLEEPLYEPDRSAKLLAEAGFVQGDPLRLEYGAGIAVHEAQAVLIQQNLSDVGIDVRLSPTDLQQYGARYQARDFSAFWLAAHAFADFSPLTLLQQSLEYRAENLSHHESPNLDRIRSSLAGLAPLDSASRALYSEFNELWLEDPFIVPTGIPRTRIDLVQSSVRGWPEDAPGYRLAPSGKVDFAAVSLDS